MGILYPKLRLQHVLIMLRHAALGALIAGAYGILHDQITYTISPEYFTRLKFLQFHYANFGLPHRVFVGEIGFLATWWVGFIAGWFIARTTVPHSSPDVALARSLRGFAIVFGVALLASTIGYLLGLSLDANADFSRWQHLGTSHNIQDLPNFVRVAYIHNASYTGGLIGLIVAILYLRRRPPELINAK